MRELFLVCTGAATELPLPRDLLFMAISRGLGGWLVEAVAVVLTVWVGVVYLCMTILGRLTLMLLMPLYLCSLPDTAAGCDRLLLFLLLLFLLPLTLRCSAGLMSGTHLFLLVLSTFPAVFQQMTWLLLVPPNLVMQRLSTSFLDLDLLRGAL